jgi:hypothetical protein
MGILERHNRRMERFPERFEGLFGYRLEDRFDDTCAMLRAGEAFAFSRFGDGEFAAIFGAEGANCDGHRYFPELGRRLERIVRSRPDYIMGLQPLAVMLHKPEPILALSDGLRWVYSDMFYSAVIEGRFGRFFDALEGREVLLVGPVHQRLLSQARGWSHHSIPAQNCWTHYREVREALQGSLPQRGAVVLFCASMMSNVLVDDLYRWSPANTYLDVGSVFDPCVGIYSRNFYREVEAESMAEIRLFEALAR